MITVTKEFSWAMSHRLEGHKGLCNSIHGHEYKLLVTVSRKDDSLIDDDISSKEMVVDFKDLKKIVKDIIINKLDHAFAYNEDDKLSSEIAEFLIEKINQKVAPLHCRATAESMSKWMYIKLNQFFSIKDMPIKCVRIKLYETPTSYAVYEE